MEATINLDASSENIPGVAYDDSNYFKLLGQILTDSMIHINNIPNMNIPYTKHLSDNIIKLLAKIGADDIIKWLSPQQNPKYQILASVICKSINNPTAAIYEKLLNSGFNPEELGVIATKLITNEQEFLKNERQIFSRYLNGESPHAGVIKYKIMTLPQFSYEFIMSYLQPKYPKIFGTDIKWTKLAITKGAIDTIYKYNLALSDAEVAAINKTYCTIQNIELYKSLAPYKVAKIYYNTCCELFKDIDLDDFIIANNITDADHTRINYVKYLGHFKIGDGTRAGGYNDSLSNTICNYHPDLVRQFLDCIFINGDVLAKCKITMYEKINYIKSRNITKEYTPKHIARFINSCYTSITKTQKPSLSEIEKEFNDAGIQMPWKELLELENYDLIPGIKWPKIRHINNVINKYNIGIYIQYLLNDCTQLSDWTPSVQVEYWNILTSNWNNISLGVREELVKVLPIEILQDIPIDKIWFYQFYKHDDFQKIINDPSEFSKSLKHQFAKIIRRELERLYPTVNHFDITIELIEIGLVITRFYSSGLEILEYFSVPGIAEVVSSTMEYRNLHVDTLLGLISLTSNNNIIHAFQAEIEYQKKAQSIVLRITEFVSLFNENLLDIPEQSELTRKVARLAAAIQLRPVKYWRKDEYKIACEKGFISADILKEFQETQPIPHPDWNWRTLTILLGTDQIILAFPELPWRTPVYFHRDSEWALRNITWEYLQNHTLLFSADNGIWSKFSNKLPIEFILERPNYNFKWGDIVGRPDKITPEKFNIIKNKLKPKYLSAHFNRFPIHIIAENMTLGWDFKKIFDDPNITIPLKYLHKFFDPSIFNNKILGNTAEYMYETEPNMTKLIDLLKYRIAISSIIGEYDSLRSIFRAINFTFGNRPHLEKMALGFINNALAINK